MFVSSLRAANWRSWHQVQVEAAAQWNIFSGHNGAGKTAILEMLWALHRQKTLRGQKLKFLRTAAAESDALSYTAVEMQSSNTPHTQASLSIDQDGSTQVRLDRESVSKAQLSLCMPMVCIQPQDTELIFGDSSIRREMVHRLAFSHSADFLSVLRSYESALTQRNALLRDSSLPVRALHQALEPWNEIFATNAARMQQALNMNFAILRASSREFLPAFIPEVEVALVEAVLPEFSGENQESTNPDFWYKMLEKWIEKDRRKGYTSVGPHRWDWDAQVAGISAKMGASFGQVRAITLALRLASADIMARVLGEAPVVLLDDLNSELDFQRRSVLMHLLASKGYQCWITTTEAEQVFVPAGISAINWQVSTRQLQRRT